MSSRSSARKPSGLPLVKQPVIDIADDDTSDDDDDDEDLGHYRQRRGYAADRSRESTCDSDITVPYTKIISTFAIDCTGSLAAFGGKKGLNIVDLEEPWEFNRVLNHQPQGRGTPWDVGVVQWNPHTEKSNMIASTANKDTYIWNLDDKRSALQATLQTHQRPVSDLNWSWSDSNVLATCSQDTFVNVWDVRDPRKPLRLKSLCAWTSGVSQVKWNHKNPFCLASCHDNDVRVWDIRKESQPTHRMAAHMQPITSLDWSPFSQYEFVTASQDKAIKVWSTETSPSSSSSSSSASADCLATINTNQPVGRVKFTPFGRGIVAVSQRADFSIKLWALSDVSYPVHSFVGHTDVVTSLDWRQCGLERQDEYQLASWSKDQHFRLWCIPTHVYSKCALGAHTNNNASTLPASYLTGIGGGNSTATTQLAQMIQPPPMLSVTGSSNNTPSSSLSSSHSSTTHPLSGLPPASPLTVPSHQTSNNANNNNTNSSSYNTPSSSSTHSLATSQTLGGGTLTSLGEFSHHMRNATTLDQEFAVLARLNIMSLAWPFWFQMGNGGAPAPLPLDSSSPSHIAPTLSVTVEEASLSKRSVIIAIQLIESIRGRFGEPTSSSSLVGGSGSGNAIAIMVKFRASFPSLYPHNAAPSFELLAVTLNNASLVAPGASPSPAPSPSASPAPSPSPSPMMGATLPTWLGPPSSIRALFTPFELRSALNNAAQSQVEASQVALDTCIRQLSLFMRAQLEKLVQLAAPNPLSIALFPVNANPLSNSASSIDGASSRSASPALPPASPRDAVTVAAASDGKLSPKAPIKLNASESDTSSLSDAGNKPSPRDKLDSVSAARATRPSTVQASSSSSETSETAQSSIMSGDASQSTPSVSMGDATGKSSGINLALSSSSLPPPYDMSNPNTPRSLPITKDADTMTPSKATEKEEPVYISGHMTPVFTVPAVRGTTLPGVSLSSNELLQPIPAMCGARFNRHGKLTIHGRVDVWRQRRRIPERTQRGRDAAVEHPGSSGGSGGRDTTGEDISHGVGVSGPDNDVQRRLNDMGRGGVESGVHLPGNKADDLVVSNIGSTSNPASYSNSGTHTPAYPASAMEKDGYMMSEPVSSPLTPVADQSSAIVTPVSGDVGDRPIGEKDHDHDHDHDHTHHDGQHDPSRLRSDDSTLESVHDDEGTAAEDDDDDNEEQIERPPPLPRTYPEFVAYKQDLLAEITQRRLQIQLAQRNGNMFDTSIILESSSPSDPVREFGLDTTTATSSTSPPNSNGEDVGGSADASSTQATIQIPKLPWTKSVVIADFSKALPASYVLAASYRLYGTRSTSELCIENAELCLMWDKPSVARIWLLLALQSSPDLQQAQQQATEARIWRTALLGPWAFQPFGRELIANILDHLERSGDVQTLVMVMCVLEGSLPLPLSSIVKSSSVIDAVERDRIRRVLQEQARLLEQQHAQQRSQLSSIHARQRQKLRHSLLSTHPNSSSASSPSLSQHQQRGASLTVPATAPLSSAALALSPSSQRIQQGTTTQASTLSPQSHIIHAQVQLQEKQLEQFQTLLKHQATQRYSIVSLLTKLEKAEQAIMYPQSCDKLVLHLNEKRPSSAERDFIDELARLHAHQRTELATRLNNAVRRLAGLPPAMHYSLTDSSWQDTSSLNGPRPSRIGQLEYYLALNRQVQAARSTPVIASESPVISLPQLPDHSLDLQAEIASTPSSMVQLLSDLLDIPSGAPGTTSLNSSTMALGNSNREPILSEAEVLSILNARPASLDALDGPGSNVGGGSSSSSFASGGVSAMDPRRAWYLSFMDPQTTARYSKYKLQYADMLLGWGLLEQRAQVLKYLSPAHRDPRAHHQGIEFGAVCRTCLREHRGGGHLCTYCQAPAFECALCHLPVKGVSIFCVTCGHGGHAQHMKTWFANNNTLCPSGCQCECKFVQ